jgi:adenylosuccinate synthase
MYVDVLLGLQWGDEGKGKIVDYIADQYDLVCRFQGGPNAGHTIKINNDKYVLHTIPSGVFRQGIKNLVGNGVVLDPITFMKELVNLDTAGIDYRDRLFISRKAHLILPSHRMLDAGSEAAKGKDKIGSTLKGIGPTYMDKTGRNGLRIGDIMLPNFKQKYTQLRDKHLSLLKLYPEIEFDLSAEEDKWFEAIEKLRLMNLVNGEYFVNDHLARGKKLLAEGAQGSMLDIDFGTYPFVTSSNTTSAGVCVGLGVAPSKIREVIGIAKAYCTRVGSGPFPTELNDDMGEKLGRIGMEFGATTGRPRRCGWIDIPQLKYTIMLNGVTQVVLTKLDVLNDFSDISVATHYNINGELTNEVPYDIVDTPIVPVLENHKGWSSDLSGISDINNLPREAKSYIDKLTAHFETPISLVSIGPERSELLK